MKFLIITLIITLLSTSGYCLDIDLVNGTFLGKPLDIKQSFFKSKFGIPTKGEPEFVLEYPAKGIYANFDGDTLGHIHFYYMSPGANNEFAPKSNIPYNGKASFGIKTGAKFGDVLEQIKKSDNRFVAYKGIWCFSYRGCTTPGHMIVLLINNSWNARISFTGDVLSNLHVNKMHSEFDYIADTRLDQGQMALGMHLNVLDRRD